MTEAEAIPLAQAGDPDAFAVLYHLHRSSVLKHCRALLHSQDAAEDASQEVFLRLHKKIGSYRGEAKFSTWLYRLTHRVCLSLLRDRKRDLPSVSEVDASSFGYPRGCRSSSFTDRDADMQKVLEKIPTPGLNAEAKLALKEALTSLPEETRAVFNASVVEGHSVQHVCRSLHTHSRSFYNRRRQAEETLKNAAVRR